MNVNPDSPAGQPADAEAQQAASSPDKAAAAAEPMVAPAKRKRSTKAASTTEEGVVSAAVADAPMASEPVVAPPARKRRTSAAKVSAQAADAVAAAGESGPPSSGQQAASPLTDAEQPVSAEPPPLHAATPVAEGGAEAPADPEQGEGQDRGRRRNRNRRRNGREDGGEGADAPRDAAPRTPVPAQSPDADADDEDEALAKLDPQQVEAQLGEVFSEVLSGAFDAEEEAATAPEADAAAAGAAAPAAPHKRVLLAEPDAPKLQKVLAQSGVGSRRDMEQMIADGLVTVNGQVAHVGQRISFGDQIKVDGRQVKVRIVPPPPRIIAYHKPVGEVVTHDDPQHRPTVFRRLPRLPQGKWQSVGRLDINTEGLLLFTNSGELANKLMHPRFGVEREYAVRVLGTLEPDAKAKLLEGVEIDGQPAAFRSIENGGGEGVNHWYRVVITEGRNREVRKLFDAVGLTVSRLIRIRYGTVVLPRGLKRGVWVDLEGGDVRLVCQLAGHVQQPRHGQNDRGPSKNNKGPNRQNDRRNGRQEFNGPRDGRGPGRGNKPQDGRRDGPPQQHQRAENNHNRTPREEGWEDDFDPARIPNPLEQTFDKRFVQNPRSPAGGRGFRNGGGGFGAGGSAPEAPPPRKAGSPREPDPLQTSVGYIGGDAYHRKGGNRGGRGGGGYGGGGGGNFGGNRGGGGGRRGR